MKYVLLKACEHGNYGSCLKCGHYHNNDGKLCHKEHKPRAIKLTKKELEAFKNLGKKK